MDTSVKGSLRTRGISALSVLLGFFVLYTCATGPFESIIQRVIFLAILVCLGVLSFPLGAGTRWRPVGIAIDSCMALVTIVSCAYIIINCHGQIDAASCSSSVHGNISRKLLVLCQIHVH